LEFDFRDIRREELNLFNYKRIHFIGIAGTGMSALAYIFAEKGYEVSGSDIQENISTIRLKAKGVKIYNGHHRENLKDVDVVIVSSAIPPENEEYLAAKEKNIPILHRSELLGELTKEKKSIIVSGTHGKTTTTSLIGLVLENNKVDPTIIVGGEVEDIGGNAKLGNGDFLVAEGDESDGSILRLFPFVLVVTNIDNDHLDYYKDLDKIKETFLKAIDKIPQDGKVHYDVI
jgi:UDP-N-acetylmuramate--alanine ligase